MPTTVSVQPVPLLQRCDIQAGPEETRVILELQTDHGECIRLHVTVSGEDADIPILLKISGTRVELPRIDWTGVRSAQSEEGGSRGAAQEESETESHMVTAADRLEFCSSPPKMHEDRDPFATPQHTRFDRAHRPSTVQRDPKYYDGAPPDPAESPSVRRKALYEQKRAQQLKSEDE